MSAFVIFVIVLTLGYILYYAATITIDLTAKQKSEADTEETIAADGVADDDDFVPHSVVENAETGGFSFSSPAPVVNEPSEEIAEAHEDVPVSEAAEEPADAEPVPAHISEGKEKPHEAEEAAPEASEEIPVEASEDGEIGKMEDTPSDEKLEQPEEESIPGVEYYVEKHEEEKPNDDFDVNDAFDPDLMTPKYGITEMVEPSVSDGAQEKAATVNASLLSIASKGNEMSSFDLSRVIREHRAEQHNIETNDEVTNY